MIKHIKKLSSVLKNKKGAMYIYIVCVFLCVCILFWFGVTYLGLVQQAKMLEENSQRVIDASVMKSSITIYNSIKNGSNFLTAFSGDDLAAKEVEIENSFDDLFCKELNLVKNGNVWERKTANGNNIYWVKDLDIKCSENSEKKQYLFITADFKIVIPTVFSDGEKSSLYNFEIPIHVESSLTDKGVNGKLDATNPGG